MTIKERLEQQERAVLGPRAMLSCQSRGPEKPLFPPTTCAPNLNGTEIEFYIVSLFGD